MIPNESTNQGARQTVEITALPEIAIKGIPSTTTLLIALVSAAFAIVVAILGFGQKSFNTSLQATEERLKSHLTDTIHAVTDPMQQHIASHKNVLTILVEKNGNFSKTDRELYKKLLGTVRSDEMQELLSQSPEQNNKLSYTALERNKQIDIQRVKGLEWDGGGAVSLKYLDVKDRNLDLRDADLYSEGSDPCRTKNLDLPGQPVGSVKLCYTHLASKNRLELIIVKPSS